MASGNLVIVESPAKAKTIGRILGGDYKIMASMGHVRDLPEHSFGVDIANNFEPRYEVTKDRTKVIKELQSAAKGAAHVWLAPDPDREGEAIAWHLQELLKKNVKVDFKRVQFHEITKSAVRKAFEQPGDINMDLVDSQQARRVLDRIVGYKISELLWSKVERGISAGRVQSVALRMVCEREREILNFKPVEYWDFIAELLPLTSGGSETFLAKLAKINGEKAEIGNTEDANKAAAAVRGAKVITVDDNQRKPVTRNPFPPFITSSLQQAAGAFGFSASGAMRVAQALYEGVDIGTGNPTGLITYMRTDSFEISAEARAACRSYISASIGPDYVPEKPNFYKSKAGSQGAHEAIRPTDVNFTPAEAERYLDKQQLKIYTLIWKRFVASQMAPARQMRTTVEATAAAPDSKKYTFRASATVTTFPGFMKIYEQAEKDQGSADSDGLEQKAPKILDSLRPGDKCSLKDLKTEQKFTEPPHRYSEATLIKELEANGIGRPSTYASIVNTIQTRAYVLKEKSKLVPTERGFKVNDYLVSALPELFQIGFTADMETKLDKIEEGEVKWTGMLSEFYARFKDWVGEAKLAGAPDNAKASSLLSCLKDFKGWAPAEKRGGRNYDDAAFFESIGAKFERDKVITANQWQALLSIAAKYIEAVPKIKAEAAKLGWLEDLEPLIARAAERLEQKKIREEEAASGAPREDKSAEIFALLKDVKWEEAGKSKKRSFDEKKFVTSLRKQAEGGKLLSEKQTAALFRMASRHKEEIKEFDKLADLFGVKPGEEPAGAAPADPAAKKETEELLGALSKVTNWAEPVKKGPRVYDDKAFYESLSRQSKEGRSLSPKQVFALKKMAAKYSSGAAEPKSEA